MKIVVNRFDNENGPVSAYLIIVSAAENSFVKTDFDIDLIGNYKKAQEEGLPYYIAAEIQPFREDSQIFTVGDGRNYGKYFNAPVKNLNEQFKAMVGT